MEQFVSSEMLSMCDQEPIHTPNRIQPHGILLALTEIDFNVLQVSSNVAQLTGVSESSLLNQPVSNLLGLPQIDPIRKRLVMDQETLKQLEVLTFYLNVQGKQQIFHGSLHRNKDDILILELEPDELFKPNREVKRSPYWHYQQIKSITTKLQKTRDIETLQALAVKEVRQLTGFERVMMYKFDADWHGHVVAESKAVEVRSFLGLHFPASDIPSQARELYRHNWLRGIADIHQEPAYLVPALNPKNQQPLDLTHAVLRSVSPVHIEYLYNMDVESSLSISVLKDDQLWGLIACHHSTPKYIDYPTRTVCEVIGQILSIQLDLCENLALYEKILRLEADKLRLEDILKLAAGLAQPRAPEAWDRLRRMVSADGVVLFFNAGRKVQVGLTPTDEQLERLFQWLQETQSSYLFFTDCLQQHYTPAAEFTNSAAGLISLHINHLELQYILWFRQEVEQTINWAGNPEKPVTTRNPRTPISPRKSFEVWRCTVKNHSYPWEIYELENAMSLYDLHEISDEFWPLNDQ